MRLQEIFQKDIYRHIEGVIKADDETNIIQEVEEYVITREIQEKLDHFFSVYSQSIEASKPTSEIGVWISGFFGSGKSHLLKMLSYILENRELNGRRVGEIFLEKIDESDFELRANIEKAISIPAKSILFNIDQKAEITSKMQPDAILSVFNKVLNELCGYSPQYAFLAELERHLDLQRIFQPFKEKYKELFGETWEKGREMVLLETEKFARALAEVKGISEAEAKQVFERYEKQDKISIEDFARKVKEYIDRQSKNFRLIFCVDEMGQYISDNSKLMLNLQTISESLATICKGRAWITVTSQEDIETLVGELKDRQEEDFSKIMARFATRINLSSANVDEVIQKRLLAKNPKGVEALVPVYDRERNNFKTIFHFGDGSRQYRTYQSEEHFINTYPFVPYQFDLFQASIRGLSRHNAFQGRHQSVGERSMLGVFQHVVQKIADEGIGRLVSYDHLFDGIRSTLRSEVQSAIINAENNLENPLDVRVLKALFLVKYVKEFTATPKNIATLLVDHLGIDLMELEKRVQESLNRLEDQTYVQQIGGVYEFLTDVEKDVENEIKATEVDIGTVRKTLSEIIFYDVLRDTKIRFEDNQREYGFARKVDYHLTSREDELTLHFITPLCEENVNESILKAESMGRRELIIQLADDPKLKQDLFLFNKTEKYIQQTQHSGLNEEVRNILNTKGMQNAERRRTLVERIEKLIADGTFYLNGNVLTLNGGSARTKIVGAFQHLIRIAYPNLRMLKKQFREEHLKQILFQTGSDLFGGSENSLSEAELEMLNFIERKQYQHERVTVKGLLEHFTRAPYGWYQPAILGVLALLFVRGKVEITHNSNSLDKKQAYGVLTNSREFANTIVDPVGEIDPRKIQKFKEFYRDFFDETLSETEPRPLVRRFQERLAKEISEIESWLQQQSRYRFLSQLQKPLELMRSLQRKDMRYLLEHLGEYEDELLDAKEEILFPIKSFMAGEQRRIFDYIVDFLTREEANLSYVGDGNLQQLQAVMESPAPYRGGMVKQAKEALTALTEVIEKMLAEERQKTMEALQQVRKKLEGLDEFQKLTPEDRETILAEVKRLQEQVEKENFIPVLRDTRQRVETILFPNLLNQINEVLGKEQPEGEGKPKTTIVALQSIRPAFYKGVLETEQDVEDYIKNLRQKMLEAIRSNKKISV